MSGIRGLISKGKARKAPIALMPKVACPAALRVAEVFMIAIVGIYVAKLILLGVGFSSGYGFREAALLSFILDTAMMFIAIDSLFTITSTDPRAWKKAARAAVLLFVCNLMYRMGMSTTVAGIVSFDPVLVAVVSAIVLICLFSQRVREHYVPVWLEDPPLKSWVAFIAFWPLFPSEHYRMAFPDEDDSGA